MILQGDLYMAETGIQATIEKLSELVVFVGPGDLQELAQMHTCLIEIREWAKSQGFNKTAIVADNSADWIEKIVLQEMENPDEALKILSQVISSFQQIILANISENDIIYPNELQQKKAGNIVVQGFRSNF